MEPLIDLAAEARKEPLACELADVIRENVIRDVQKRASFDRLRGGVAIVADDIGVSLTLRFDFGQLVLHIGIIGTPDVTIRGTAQAIRSLCDLPHATWMSLSVAAIADGNARQSVRNAIGALKAGRLKIYGLALHPRLVTHLLRVLSKKS